MRQRQEKKRIEDPTVKRALHELLVPSIPLKLAAGSETGRPDQVFLIPHGKPLFIEFKWGELLPDPKQEYWHDVLRKLGYEVQVHNSVELALTAIALKVVAAAIHAEGAKVSPRTQRGRAFLRPRTAKDLHYVRSLQFLKERGYSEQNACDRAIEGSL
jgi:hypothetical protein